MSVSSIARAAVYSGLPVPPGTSGSGIPPSSLYWIQKSASSSSSAAGNRSSAASPVVKPPRPAFVLGVLPSKPRPIVPAPAASDPRRNARRLKERRRELAFVSDLLVTEGSSLLMAPVASGFVVFITVASQLLIIRAVFEK